MQTDSGDCTAASDSKHPGWRCPFPPRLLHCGLGEDRFREGCCHTVTSDCDRETSFLSFSPPPSSAPWLPDDNSGVPTHAARLSLYWYPRHWDSKDNEQEALQAILQCGRRVRLTGCMTQSPLNLTQYQHRALLTNDAFERAEVSSSWCFSSELDSVDSIVVPLYRDGEKLFF